MKLCNDNGTDGQTDRQTDRVRRNMRPPPREEGGIINYCGNVCILPSAPFQGFGQPLLSIALSCLMHHRSIAIQTFNRESGIKYIVFDSGD